MSKITTLYAWTLHISRQDNEWEALCGADHPDMLTDPTLRKPLHGLKTCPECLRRRRAYQPSKV